MSGNGHQHSGNGNANDQAARRLDRAPQGGEHRRQLFEQYAVTKYRTILDH